MIFLPNIVASINSSFHKFSKLLIFGVLSAKIGQITLFFVIKNNFLSILKVFKILFLFSFGIL